MGVKKVTGLKGVDAVLAAFLKKNEDVQVGMGAAVETSEVFSSGSVTLDCQLGCGGIPVDRVIEIFGPESGGKTSLSLMIMSAWQDYEAGRERTGDEEERIAAFIDLERTTDTKFMQGYGIDTEKVLYVRPNTAEQALQLAINLGKSQGIGCIIFDSVDAAQTEEEVKKDIDENSMATLPRKMSKAMREISKIATDEQVLYLFINQERDTMSMYSGPTTSGGRALKYYSSLRLRVSSKISSKEAQTLTMKIAVKKNKLAMQGGEAVLEFVVGAGVDSIADLITSAKNLGLIRFAGSAVKYNGDDETLCSGGAKGLTEYIKENPDFHEKLKSACAGGELTNEE